jgi:AraC-like DNA-binding protein
MPASKSTSATGAPLIEAISRKALPWVESNGADRIIVVCPTFKEMQMASGSLPEGVKITPRPFVGRRVIVRDRPAGLQLVNARWPEDGLDVKRLPIITCTISGPAELRISDYILHCPEGCFIFIPAGIPHSDYSRVHLEGDNWDRRQCDILWFSPAGEVLRCWICHSENGKHSSLPALNLGLRKLLHSVELLFEDYDGEISLCNKIRQGLLIVLLASVQNEIQQGHFFRWLPQPLNLAPEDEADPIKRAQSYVREHLGEALTIERVARHCYMSRSQFAKMFRAETGETFNTFLTSCRLEEAKLRLTTTTAQIAGLSRHVGLKPRHFNQLFLRHTGLTPGAYRRLHSTHSEP